MRTARVGDEVRQAFCDSHAPSIECFRPLAQRSGKWWCDLPALVRQRLQRAGVRHLAGNDGSASWCTLSNPERFFSYRREPTCGRMVAAIFLTPGRKS